jgi:hypothetical protein
LYACIDRCNLLIDAANQAFTVFDLLIDERKLDEGFVALIAGLCEQLTAETDTFFYLFSLVVELLAIFALGKGGGRY